MLLMLKIKSSCITCQKCKHKSNITHVSATEIYIYIYVHYTVYINSRYRRENIPSTIIVIYFLISFIKEELAMPFQSF